MKISLFYLTTIFSVSFNNNRCSLNLPIFKPTGKYIFTNNYDYVYISLRERDEIVCVCLCAFASPKRVFRRFLIRSTSYRFHNTLYRTNKYRYVAQLVRQLPTFSLVKVLTQRVDHLEVRSFSVRIIWMLHEITQIFPIWKLEQTLNVFNLIFVRNIENAKHFNIKYVILGPLKQS